MKREKSQKEELVIAQLYGKEATLAKQDFLRFFKVKEEGLSSSEAETHLQKHGLNIMKHNNPKKWYHYLLESLFSTFNCILLRNCSHLILY